MTQARGPKDPLLAIAASICVFLVGLSQVLPPKGDEITYYRKVHEAWFAAWPNGDLSVVHHGLSPIYLWIAAGISTLLFSMTADFVRAARPQGKLSSKAMKELRSRGDQPVEQ